MSEDGIIEFQTTDEAARQREESETEKKLITEKKQAMSQVDKIGYVDKPVITKIQKGLNQFSRGLLTIQKNVQALDKYLDEKTKNNGQQIRAVNPFDAGLPFEKKESKRP